MGWSTQKGEEKKFHLKVNQLTAGVQQDLNQPKATQFHFFSVYRTNPCFAFKGAYSENVHAILHHPIKQAFLLTL